MGELRAVRRNRALIEAINAGLNEGQLLGELRDDTQPRPPARRRPASMKGSSWESCGIVKVQAAVLSGVPASMKGSSWESCGVRNPALPCLLVGGPQ